MADATQPLQTYRGNCHCKAFVYEVKVPEIKQVFECNCSLCVRKGYLFVFTEAAKLDVVKGSLDQLTTYTFGSETFKHKFCPDCGTAVLCTGPTGIALNVHTIQDLNTWDLDISPIDGASYGNPYQPPAHKGELPTAEVEGGIVYTGSCHCGDVTVAVNSKPLDETYDEKVAVCNCSICERLACMWIYPRLDQVVLTGQPNCYVFALNILDKTFCKRCGVPLTNRPREPSAEELARIPEAERSWIPAIKERHAVNARVLQGVDLGALKVVKVKGAAGSWPVYENP